ncbi:MULTISPECIES: hypothetical protein [Methylomonas]|uniref:Uncharacterized protein n=2 Tax=Methylomonas TaxID=416 RepID=A0A126T957_9GAMM|nr:MULTISPECIES: hypothetical protein [Methylomonas]AMK78324.1 hypothetical protein JT25_017830 [Methylomonas denitrificans]OAI04037.1 hypothetical protein A1342_05765 [Methylomonas methanica]TCV87645.1 hypothetical protein EDE11_102148 [Methylomonas methanica]
MSYEYPAKQTLTQVRKFYKGQIKSSNKAYLTRNNPQDTWVMDNSTEKKALRNKNAVLSYEQKQSFEHNDSNFSIGEKLYKANNTVGNCGLMARVAMYVAINQFGVSKAKCRIGKLAYQTKAILGVWGDLTGFGHEYLVIGDLGEERWIVDPWANLVCKHTDFTQQLTRKLSQWKTDGKRIEVCIKGKSGFVEPDDSLVTKITTQRETLFGADDC